LTPPQAARALSISGRTLWTLTNEGKIPHLRVGRQIRYGVAALEEWIAKQSAAAPVPVADSN
jgi:excisionase family DNA binding protein